MTGLFLYCTKHITQVTVGSRAEPKDKQMTMRNRCRCGGGLLRVRTELVGTRDKGV